MYNVKSWYYHYCCLLGKNCCHATSRARSMASEAVSLLLSGLRVFHRFIQFYKVDTFWIFVVFLFFFFVVVCVSKTISLHSDRFIQLCTSLKREYTYFLIFKKCHISKIYFFLKNKLRLEFVSFLRQLPISLSD